MNYYRKGDDYIATKGTVEDAETITEEEFAQHYTEVLEVISHYPEELTAEEALAILMGDES